MIALLFDYQIFLNANKTLSDTLQTTTVPIRIGAKRDISGYLEAAFVRSCPAIVLSTHDITRVIQPDLATTIVSTYNVCIITVIHIGKIQYSSSQ